MDLERLLMMLREANARHGAGPVVVYLVYPDGASELLTLPGASVPQERCVIPGARVPTDTERAVLTVLEQAEQPLKGRTIASRARARGFELDYNSHLRRTLAAMSKPEDGRLIHVGRDGYWLASREIPDMHTET